MHGLIAVLTELSIITFDLKYWLLCIRPLQMGMYFPFQPLVQVGDLIVIIIFKLESKKSSVWQKKKFTKDYCKIYTCRLRWTFKMSYCYSTRNTF